MKTSKLSVREINELTFELGGVKDTEFKGLIEKDISQKGKAHLTKLFKEVAELSKDFNALRDNLVKEHGTIQSDNSYIIDKEPEQYQSKLKELLDVEHEISHYEFKIEDVEPKTATKEFYPVLYSIIDL